MNDDRPDTRERASQAFLQLIRKRFSHDMRGPLGTIVNYAALLEDERTNDLAQVHDYARRVRVSAMRAASMLQAMSTASAAISSDAPAEPIDLADLVRRAAAQSGHAADVRVASHAAHEDGPAVVGHPALIAFAASAFLQLLRELSDGAPLSLTCEATSEAPACEFWLWSGARPDQVPAAADLEQLLRDEGRRVSTECTFSLRLAADLASASGGAFELCGRPGGAFGAVFRAGPQA